MRTSIFITGIGWITPLSSGNGLRLIRGQTHQARFGGDRLPQIAPDELFADPVKHYGRMDDFSRLGLAGIALALEDAGLHVWRRKRPIGLIAATVAGSLATDQAYWQTVTAGRPSPALFSRTLPNTFLGDAAIVFGLTGQAFVVNTDQANQMALLVWGAQELLARTCRAMVVGLCDVAQSHAAAHCQGVQPGALFMVLQRSAQNYPGHYGVLDASRLPALNFHGRAIENMVELANACLAIGRNAHGQSE